MPDQSRAHDAVAWARQRLDEVDAMIASAETALLDLQEQSRAEAAQGVERLRAIREALKTGCDRLGTEAEAALGDATEAQKALAADWVEAEATFLAFLSATRDRSETARALITARAEAQQRSWQDTLAQIRGQATKTLETVHADLDSAVQRLFDELEKVQARAGDLREAGDQSWAALKVGLSEAKAVQDRTLQKIREAFGKPK